MGILTVIFSVWSLVDPGRYNDKIEISRTYEIKDPNDFRVIVRNVNGDVDMVVHDKNTVELTLMIEISANEQADVNRGKEELDLGETKEDGFLLLRMKAPFIKEWKENGIVKGTSFYYEPDYNFKYQFKLKIPKSVHVEACTINKGDVFIEGISGEIKAGNVNGGIEIKNARNVRNANTVNGDIRVSYQKNPSKDSRFHTVNGDITLLFNKDLAALVSSKSMNGELYSAFDFQYQKPSIEKNSKRNRHGVEYKIGGRTRVAIGGGGPEMKFETLNGNVYLKEKS